MFSPQPSPPLRRQPPQSPRKQPFQGYVCFALQHRNRVSRDYVSPQPSELMGERWCRARTTVTRKFTRLKGHTSTMGSNQPIQERIVTFLQQYSTGTRIFTRVVMRNSQPVTSGPNLQGANLSGTQLEEVVLNGANLHQANFSWANLRRADLSQTNLAAGNFWHANLNQALLQGAKLNGAFLVGADLTEAELAGADLSGANLKDAILNGTNLAGAILNRTVMPDGTVHA